MEGSTLGRQAGRGAVAAVMALYHGGPSHGPVMYDTVTLVCDTVDCCPWFETSDLEVRGWGRQRFP